jgi:putative lipoprotein
VSTNRPVVIDGEAAGITEGNVFVRALDSMGVVLDEQRVNVTRPTNQNGTWTWEVDLDLFDASPGSRGTLLAYARNVTNGAILVADARSIVFDQEPTGPWIRIESPLPYANTAEDGIVTIVGRGSGLFENNVVVEVQDDVGNVLSIAPTIVDTNEIGGTGFWEVNFAVDHIGRGAVVAYATEPVNGTRVAEAKTDVFYGDPRLLDEYVVVTYPLPNTIVTGAASVLSAAGYAGGIDPDTLRIVVMDANSRIIMTLPALVDTETGLWTLNLSGPLSIDRDQRATIHALAGDGSVTASDVVPIQAEQPAVTGFVTYRQRIALPPDAVVHIMLQNTSIADAPPSVTMLGEEYITSPGQVPIPFAVKYDATEVDRRMNYGIRVRIEDGGGQLLFMNTQSVPVLTQGNPSRNVEVLVEQMP